MHSLYSLTATPITYIFQNSLTEKIVLKADNILGQLIYSVWDTGYLRIEFFKYVLANFSYFASTMSGWIVLLDNFWFVCISITVIISLRFNLRFLHFLSSFFVEILTIAIFAQFSYSSYLWLMSLLWSS